MHAGCCAAAVAWSVATAAASPAPFGNRHTTPGRPSEARAPQACQRGLRHPLCHGRRRRRARGRAWRRPRLLLRLLRGPRRLKCAGERVGGISTLCPRRTLRVRVHPMLVARLQRTVRRLRARGAAAAVCCASRSCRQRAARLQAPPQSGQGRVLGVHAAFLHDLKGSLYHGSIAQAAGQIAKILTSA